jgi:hypothetical protein
MELAIHPENNITSFSSVTSIRTTLGKILLPPEAYTAVTAISGRNLDFCIVDEHFTGIYFTSNPRTGLSYI